MTRKILIIIATIFFIISCNKNGANKNVQKPDDLTNVEELASGVTVINTDCDYYDDYMNLHKGFSKGQRIIILENFTSDEKLEVFVKVQTTDSGIEGYINEKYITYNSVNYDFWFKNVLMTRSYYYTEPVEYIFNEYEKNRVGHQWSKKELLQLWQNFYSENRIRFSENYLVTGNDEYTVAFRLEEIIHKSGAKDGSAYIIKLIDSSGEKQELTLVDDGNSITITQCDIGDHLLYTYVPYDKEKSEKTAKAVDAWCTEQIDKL
jgi:hypothetical protein